MLPSSELWLLGLAILVQLLGLVAAIVARLSETSDLRGHCYRAFYSLLLAVFGITLVAVWVGHGLWIFSGTTLAVMAVGATLDMGRRQPASAF